MFLNTHPKSPDLALNNFHLFLYLKNNLGGKHFDNDEDVKSAVKSLLSEQVVNHYKEGF